MGTELQVMSLSLSSNGIFSGETIADHSQNLLLRFPAFAIDGKADGVSTSARFCGLSSQVHYVQLLDKVLF